jgi:hypothetical protein
MQTTFLIIIIVLLVLCVIYLYGLIYSTKENHKYELESKDLEIEHLTAHKKFHEEYFFKLDKKFYSEEEVLEHLNRLITMPSSELDKFTNNKGLITVKWFEKFSKLKKL